MQPAQAPVRVGEVLAGKYQVERVLGAGGMGVVVAATHLQLDQLVALKFVHPEVVGDPLVAQRFLREAKMAVRLRSEHVARITDVGMLDNGSPFIVMEYLEGQDIGRYLAARGALPVQTAVDFILQAADAIDEAHSHGIVHRDLKPGNLFLTQGSHGRCLIKVLDFGISKMVHAPSELTVTRTNVVMGSPAYMPPEQMRSARLVDGRADIWSLGVLLHEMVVGHVPWVAESFTELCLKIAMDPLPAMPAVPGVPGALGAVIARCLEKDPARRFRNVEELVRALAPFAGPVGRHLSQRFFAASVPQEPLPMAAPCARDTLDAAVGSRDRTHDRRSGASGLFIGAGALAALGIAVAVGFAAGARGKKEEVRAAATPAPAPVAAPTVVVMPIATPVAPVAAPAPPAPAPPPAVASPPPRPVRTTVAAPRPVAPPPAPAPPPETPVARSAPDPAPPAPEPVEPPAKPVQVVAMVRPAPPPPAPLPVEIPAPPPARSMVVPLATLEALRISGGNPTLPSATRLAAARERTPTLSATYALCLAENGVPTSVSLKKSSRYPEADDAIQEQIRAWRFRPYEQAGQAVPVCTAVVLNYRVE